ncbi:MotA/TolQ/ExbB proton channel family protein [Myxococcota bacterium]|nr:MotA/TolQ/ExbB proton channel family protein [Myxococcota bacterium]
MSEKIMHLLDEGGVVMPALFFLGILMWNLIILRIYLLQRGFGGSLLERIGFHQTNKKSESEPLGLDGFIADSLRLLSEPVETRRALITGLIHHAQLNWGRHRTLIRGLVVVAPLLGLLGTVTGMIEAFSSLTTSAFFSQSGGIAGGISEALVSTQMGLLVAIPGIIAGRWLERKEATLLDEMKRVRERLLLPEHALNGETP